MAGLLWRTGGQDVGEDLIAAVDRFRERFRKDPERLLVPPGDADRYLVAATTLGLELAEDPPLTGHPGHFILTHGEPGNG